MRTRGSLRVVSFRSFFLVFFFKIFLMDSWVRIIREFLLCGRSWRFAFVGGYEGFFFLGRRFFRLGFFRCDRLSIFGSRFLWGLLAVVICRWV